MEPRNAFQPEEERGIVEFRFFIYIFFVLFLVPETYFPLHRKVKSLDIVRVETHWIWGSTSIQSFIVRLASVSFLTDKDYRTGLVENLLQFSNFY